MHRRHPCNAVESVSRHALRCLFLLTSRSRPCRRCVHPCRLPPTCAHTSYASRREMDDAMCVSQIAIHSCYSHKAVLYIVTIPRLPASTRHTHTTHTTLRQSSHIGTVAHEPPHDGSFTKQVPSPSHHSDPARRSKRRRHRRAHHTRSLTSHPSPCLSPHDTHSRYSSSTNKTAQVRGLRSTQ